MIMPPEPERQARRVCLSSDPSTGRMWWFPTAMRVWSRSVGASRARSGAKIIGITGSAGKTGTKEALFRCVRPDELRRRAPLAQKL